MCLILPEKCGVVAPCDCGASVVPAWQRPTRPHRSSSRARKTRTARIEIAAPKKKGAPSPELTRIVNHFTVSGPDTCLNSTKLKIRGIQYWDARQKICEPFGVYFQLRL